MEIEEPGSEDLAEVIPEEKEIFLEIDFEKKEQMHIGFALNQKEIVVLTEKELYEHLGALLSSEKLSNTERELILSMYHNFFG